MKLLVILSLIGLALGTTFTFFNKCDHQIQGMVEKPVVQATLKPNENATSADYTGTILLFKNGFSGQTKAQFMIGMIENTDLYAFDKQFDTPMQVETEGGQTIRCLASDCKFAQLPHFSKTGENNAAKTLETYGGKTADAF